MQLKYADQSRKEIKKRFDNFKFTTPKTSIPNILIWGEQGQGKTHLACSIAGNGKPVYFLDSEQKGGNVVKKFNNIHYAKWCDWKDLMAACLSLQKAEPGWVIIDSGSDFQTWAQEDYLEETKKDKIYPVFEWTNIFQRLDTAMGLLKEHGLIFTSRMKDEYIGDQSTGKKIPRIYNRLPYKVDLIFALEKDKLFLAKNGYHKDLSNGGQIELDRNTSLYNLIKQINKGNK